MSHQLLSEDIPVPDLRPKDTKNRQNSTDDLDLLKKVQLMGKIEEHFMKSRALYEELLLHDVAKHVFAW